MLLDLPPEILEMVLLLLPPDSFAVALMTCKTIRDTALSSEKILRTQLMKVPGTRLPDGLSPKHLLDSFNERATRVGWNGIEAFADVTVHEPLLSHISKDSLRRWSVRDLKYLSSTEMWTRPKINIVQRCCRKGCERGVIAAAADFEGRLHLYQIQKKRITPCGLFDPRTLELDDDDGDRRIRYHCQHLCFGKFHGNHIDHLVALYSYDVETFANEGSKFKSMFVSDAVQTSRRFLKLCVWTIMDKAGLVFSNRPSYVCDVERLASERPVALAASEEGIENTVGFPVAVILKTEGRLLHRIVLLHLKNGKVSQVQVDTGQNLIVKETDDKKFCSLNEPVARARFLPHSHLWLYNSNGTAPIDVVKGCVRDGPPRLRSIMTGHRAAPNLFPNSAALACWEGLPIQLEHGHEIGTYDNGNKYCVQTILELVIPRVGPNGAFLVKYAEEQDSCAPIDLNSELPLLEYTVVAKLLHSEATFTSPVKRLIAFSPNKNRVAIADWDRIRIWWINPTAFLRADTGSLPATPPQVQDGEATCAPPTRRGRHNKAMRMEYAMDANEDKAYTTNCGQGYWHDYIRIKGPDQKRIVGIPPVELPSRGVVHSMAWAGKHVLWAWTDRGLVKWNWGKGRWRERMNTPLRQMTGF